VTDASVTSIATRMRARGIRVSAARRLVLEALAAADHPVTADEIAGGLGGALPASDLASAYRNLERLGREGFVRHLHMGDGPRRWVLAEAEETGFMVCERCGDTRVAGSAELARVRDAIRAALGFEPSFAHTPLAGTCARCRLA
jgi:Fur family ferric uptake transcriptional regulator